MFYDHNAHACSGHDSRLLSVYWSKETASLLHLPLSWTLRKILYFFFSRSEFIIPASLPRYKKVVQLSLRVRNFVYLRFQFKTHGLFYAALWETKGRCPSFSVQFQVYLCRSMAPNKILTSTPLFLVHQGNIPALLTATFPPKASVCGS